MDRLHPELIRVVRRGKGIFVAWTRVSRRSEELSRRLGFEFYRLERLDRPSFLKPFSHLVKAGRTLAKFAIRGPGTILCFQAHPLISLTALVYKVFSGCRVIPDLHTAAYINYDVFPVNLLNSLLWRSCDLVLVHNERSRKFLIQNRPFLAPRLFVLEDPIPQFSESTKEASARWKKAGKTAVVISRFSADEPIEAVIEAARMCSDVCFYMTGDYRKAAMSIRNSGCENLSLTGFLPFEDYVALLDACDIALALTTREYTLLSGGYEALSLDKPLIVSDTKTLKDYFGHFSVYTDNTASGMSRSISHIFGKLEFYRELSAQLRRAKSEEWDRKFSGLCRVLQVSLNT